MKIHHLRNATCVIESQSHFILIDPMLGPKNSIPPFSYFRFRPRLNPLKDLPSNANSILEKVTHCLITHSQKWRIKALQHTDHLDAAGENFLRVNNIPVTTIWRDAKILQKYGLNIRGRLKFWRGQALFGGKITAVPARHGHSLIHQFMANGAGFFLNLPGEPSLYISGDTVFTPDVERALSEFKPDIAIMAAGIATLDVGKPILMPLDEQLEFIRQAPGIVIANHLESLNHCPATREQLKQVLDDNHLRHKVSIPDDGDVLSFEKEAFFITAMG